MIPADETPDYFNDLTNQASIINTKNSLSTSITPVFFDDFNTPEGLPSDTNYFNGYSNNIFSNNVFNGGQNPFSDYSQTALESLKNCEIPQLPNLSQFLPGINNLSGLLNFNIFDQALKILSILPKAGGFPVTDLFNILTGIAGGALNGILGPISGYLKNISNCLKKL